MRKTKEIKKLSKDLFILEKELDKYQLELVADVSNAEASQKFSDTSDKIEKLREDIKIIKEESKE